MAKVTDKQKLLIEAERLERNAAIDKEKADSLRAYADTLPELSKKQAAGEALAEELLSRPDSDVCPCEIRLGARHPMAMTPPNVLNLTGKHLHDFIAAFDNGQLRFG